MAFYALRFIEGNPAEAVTPQTGPALVARPGRVLQRPARAHLLWEPDARSVYQLPLPEASRLKAAAYTVEVASEAEIPCIQQVADLSWRRAFGHILSPSEIDRYMATSFSPERLRARIAESDFFVANEGADVVGFGAFGDRGNGPELLLLYVRPSHWRRGVGGALLSRLEVAARDRGIEEYLALVHRENERGKAFYQKCGFEHRKERDQADHWGMVKSLL